MAQYRAMIRDIDMCDTQYPLIRFEKIINGGKNRHTKNKYVAIHGQTYEEEKHTFRVYIDQVGSKKLNYLIKSIAAQQRGNIKKSKARQSSKIHGSAVQTSKHVPDEVAVDTEKEQTDDEDEAPIVVAAKKRKILPALPMPQPGDHLTSIEMRIFGKGYKDMSKNMAAEERIEKLERELELPKDSNMTMKQRVLGIETEATRCAW